MAKKPSKIEMQTKMFNENMVVICSVLKGCRDLLTVCGDMISDTREMVKQNNKVTDNVDETLGNVLLAIRQNEYLKAWYPAQHGFPEMKVEGKHPAKTFGGKRA